jgi:uncharacterized membrane protein YdjX (TVP38/TMEM64 family)
MTMDAPESETHEPETNEPENGELDGLDADPSSSMRWFRLGLIAALVVIILFAAWQTGVMAWMTKENLRGLLVESGATGLGIFILACCVGLFVHVPGIVFVSAAALGYGPWMGALVAFVAETIAVCVTFIIVRLVGGQPLAEIKNRWMRKAMHQIEARPLVTVVILRTAMQASPPLNYALALSPVGSRDYVIGSAIGLIAPCIVLAWAVHGLFG